MHHPPPEAQTPSLMTKLIVVCGLIIVCYIPTLFILGVAHERSERALDVQREVGSEWGAEQIISGPFVVVPVIPGPEDTVTQYQVYTPDTYTNDITATVETRSRGIYDATVYTSSLRGSGEITILNDVNSNLNYGEARVVFFVTDPHDARPDATLRFGASETTFSINTTDFGRPALVADVAITPNAAPQLISSTIELKGNRSLSVMPTGERVDTVLNSNWADPSFTGFTLPESHDITADGFTANWSTVGITLASDKRYTNASFAAERDAGAIAYSTTFIETVTFYTQVERTIKYALLFLTLTFLVFFLYEVLGGLRLHPIHYGLVGLALGVFYLLLLSIAEIIGFLPAYLIAGGATISLITLYTSSILKSVMRALGLAAGLIALYGYLYVLLQLENYSLLFGSLLLFVILAGVMIVTRNIDWYNLGR